MTRFGATETAKTPGGNLISWGVRHESGDRLISRQASVAPPVPPQCIRPSCLIKYVWETLTYTLILNYHARRVAYAEANKNKDILERYRTGEPSPETMWQAIHANIKLTCSVCRKYNVDPLLGRKQ